MSIVLLSVAGPLELSDAQVKTWRDAIDRKLGDNKKLTKIAGAPLEATVELDGAPSDDDVVLAVVAAFKQAGITSGTVDVAVSEHEADDEELETPPFFEETLDLAELDARSRYATVQADLYTETNDYAALDRELRARFTAIEYLGPISNTTAYRLVLQPMPSPPARDAFLAQLREATAAANVTLVRLSAGAYIGDWGNTIFEVNE